jgi:hypothetical protein
LAAHLSLHQAIVIFNQWYWSTLARRPIQGSQGIASGEACRMGKWYVRLTHWSSPRYMQCIERVLAGLMSLTNIAWAHILSTSHTRLSRGSSRLSLDSSQWQRPTLIWRISGGPRARSGKERLTWPGVKSWHILSSKITSLSASVR